MKITLKNFRCYENTTFDFGENGLTLISGPSGAGKTSILLGIYFALFGKGIKVVKSGKRSCSVILKIDDIVVTRTKCPNRLVLLDDNIEYEDDAAQHIIDKRFGNIFKSAAYISQNSKDSFVMMTPIKKLDFIEQFAFKDTNLIQIKKKVKGVITEKKEDFIKTQSQLELLVKMLSEIDKPEEVKFPVKCSDKNRDKIIKNEEIKYKNCKTLIKNLDKKIDKLNNTLNNLKILNVKNNKLKNDANNLKIQLEELNNELLNIKYIGDNEVNKYKEKLKYILSKRELKKLNERYYNDKNRLLEIKRTETDDKKNKIDELKNSLWVEYTEDECNDIIKESKDIIKDLDKISELESELFKHKSDGGNIKEIEIELESFKESLLNYSTICEKIKLQRNTYKCPSCDVSLKLSDKNLYIVKKDEIHNDKLEDILNIIKDLENKINNKENELVTEKYTVKKVKDIKKVICGIKNKYESLPILEETKSDVEYIIEYKSIQKDNIKQMKKLETNINSHSSSIRSLENDLEIQYKNIQSLQKLENSEYKDIKDTEEELRGIIKTNENNKTQLEYKKNNIKNISKKIDTYNNEIKENNECYIKTYKKIYKESSVLKTIEKSKSEKKDFNNQIILHENNLEQIKLYKKYKEKITKYNTVEQRVSLLKNDEVESRKKYGASMLLKQKILEAESISINNIISSINSHLQIFLDLFFVNDPISIKLMTFKKSKNGSKKPEINLEIEYKGIEADINMLSGGEISRVILAFSLSFGEMFNTPIFLLDECTSSLDQELTGDVMEGIRDHFSGKLILIIAHQVVNGQFDRVIKV